jgi:hypothetical protein
MFGNNQKPDAKNSRVKSAPLQNIQIGDKAAFNKERDKVFWVNDGGYFVRSAQAR